jgi:hypothetical protein
MKNQVDEWQSQPLTWVSVEKWSNINRENADALQPKVIKRYLNPS